MRVRTGLPILRHVPSEDTHGLGVDGLVLVVDEASELGLVVSARLLFPLPHLGCCPMRRAACSATTAGGGAGGGECAPPLVHGVAGVAELTELGVPRVRAAAHHAVEEADGDVPFFDEADEGDAPRAQRAERPSQQLRARRHARGAAVVPRSG